jgi:hypothetical protein
MTTNTSTVTTLSLIRSLIEAKRKSDAAVVECDNHYQAWYDRGYAEQYHQESAELRRTYYYWSNQVDHIEHMLYDRLNQDSYDFSRARRIASKHA